MRKYTKEQKLNSQNNDTSTKFTKFLLTYTFKLTKSFDISNRNYLMGFPGAGKYQISRNHAFNYMDNPNNSKEIFLIILIVLIMISKIFLIVLKVCFMR